MKFFRSFNTPFADLVAASDGERLFGLWWRGQKHFPAQLNIAAESPELPVFVSLQQWLQIYCAGEQPDFVPDTAAIGTDFQHRVWQLLRQIPYGETVTYGEIARELARGSRRPVAAQAVGSAVGRNPLSLVVPCHRVLGAGGKLTGYAGGLLVKEKLLCHEGLSCPVKTV